MPPTPEQTGDFNGQYQAVINSILTLLYHPACPFSYSNNPADPHPTTLLDENGRRGHIDTPLVPLMRQIWRAGCHTVGSCHNIGSGLAYITFVAAGLGGNTFMGFLQQMGIRHSIDANPMMLDLVAGQPLGKLVFHSVTVRFPCAQIGAIAAAMQHVLDQPVAAGQGG